MRTNITTFASLVMLTAALASCSKPEQADTQTAIDAESEVAIERPSYAITTDEAFSAADIAPYSGNHQKVYDHIDANLDSHIAELQRWLQQQSGSAENLGVREMAELILDDFEALGFQESELVETDGHPGVWGYYDAGAEKTLMVYMMYDVQPVNPEDWVSPPFAANVIDHPSVSYTHLRAHETS